MTLYNDIYMRDGLTDIGQVPNPLGVFWISPDIIPYGTTNQPQNPQQFFASNWSSDVGTNLAAQQTNYIYVRGKNLWNGPETGQILLYWAKSSMLLDVPQWLPNKLSTASNPFSSVSASAQGSIVVGDPFQWNVPSPPTTFHYCLLAIVGTPNNQPPIPSEPFSNSTDYANWVLNNPAVAMRNVTIVPYPPPPSWQQTQTFINLDDTAEEYLFTADISAFPSGTVVSFSCSASGPQPAIQASATVPTPKPSGPYYVSCVSTLPANFSSSLVVTIQVPGGQPVPPAGIYIRYGKIVDEDDTQTLKSFARPLRMFAALPELDPDMQVVILGSCTVQFQPGGNT